MPSADATCPSFLALYAAIIGATILGSFRALRRVDPTSTADLPEVPSDPDPYEVAYLLGGAKQVLRTAVFHLTESRHLAICYGMKPATTEIEKMWDGPSPPDHPIESLLLKALPGRVAPRKL